MSKLLTMKQVYALYLVEGCNLTHRQAAKIMRITRSAVSQLLRRTKNTINECKKNYVKPPDEKTAPGLFSD